MTVIIVLAGIVLGCALVFVGLWLWRRRQRNYPFEERAAKIQEALGSGSALQIVYWSEQRRWFLHRLVTPLKLVGEVLTAYDHSGGVEREFAVTRIKSVEIVAGRTQQFGHSLEERTPWRLVIAFTAGTVVLIAAVFWWTWLTMRSRVQPPSRPKPSAVQQAAKRPPDTNLTARAENQLTETQHTESLRSESQSTETQRAEIVRTRTVPPSGEVWSLLIENDGSNSIDYGSSVLQRVFEITEEEADKLMMTVRTEDRAVVWSGELQEGADYYRQLRDARLTVKALNAEQAQMFVAMAHYAEAESVQRARGLDAALPEYVRGFELYPKNTAAGLTLAQAYLAKNDYAKALSVLDTASKANPASPDLWLWMGIARHTANQPSEAIAAFRQALKLDPLHIGAMRALVEIYLQEDSTSAALELLERAWEQQPKEASYWIGLGETYTALLKEKPSLAKQIDRVRVRVCYERALRLAPDNADIMLRLADLYVEAGDFEHATDVYSKLLVVRPDASGLRERLALTYKAAGEKRKAATIFEEIIKRDPLQFEAYNALGDLYMDLGQHEQAAVVYEQSLTLNPDQLDVYRRVVLAAMELKRPNDAIKALDRARQRFPTRPEAYYLLGQVHRRVRNYTEAVSAFGEAERLAASTPSGLPLDGAFYFAYGSACERAGDIEKAATTWRKAIELDPDNHVALNNLACMWADNGIHLDEALQLIERAVRMVPDRGSYVDTYGWLLFKLGRTEEAAAHLRRAAELDKNNAAIHDHLADALMKLGQRDEALAQLRKARELDPDNKEIIEKIQKYSTAPSAAR